MRHATAFALVVLSAGVARAQPIGDAGLSIALLPVGTVEAQGGGLSTSTDTAFAVGLTPFVDFFLGTPYLSVGMSPQILFNVKASNDSSSATQLDVLGRIMGHAPLSPNAELFLRVSPGFSIIYPPNWPQGVSNPTGFVLGFAGGFSYVFPANVFVLTEVGYQIGFQGVTQNGISVDIDDRYLNISLGFGARF